VHRRYPCLARRERFCRRPTHSIACLNTMFKIRAINGGISHWPCCDFDSKHPRVRDFWQQVFKANAPIRPLLRSTARVKSDHGQDEEVRHGRFASNEASEERFRRYLPFPSFVNRSETIPTLKTFLKFRQTLWEFPWRYAPDWSAQHVQKPNTPQTVTMEEAALDAVSHEGVFKPRLSPHNWINRPDDRRP